jgi:hypothetical protein
LSHEQYWSIIPTRSTPEHKISAQDNFMSVPPHHTLRGTEELNSMPQRALVLLGATATATATIAVSIWIYRCIQEYGCEGLVNYIWEGDPYTPETRAEMDRLDKAIKTVTKLEKKLERLEESLARGELSTVDDGCDDQLLIQWTLAYFPGNLETDLAACSDGLDKVAFKVDSIESPKEVRQKKKETSRRIVVLMERTDELVNSYKRWKQAEL